MWMGQIVSMISNWCTREGECNKTRRKMASNTSWRIDDMDGGLDGGLASELLNLTGLGNEYVADGAYNMRCE